MKKLFISVPMKGRTDEQIRASIEKMHKAAEALVGEDLEVISSYFEYNPPENVNKAVFYLGDSIKKLAEADYMACIEYIYEYRGCSVESSTARSYGIPTIDLPAKYVCPDVFDNFNELKSRD